jgi:hypothetical protein
VALWIPAGALERQRIDLLALNSLCISFRVRTNVTCEAITMCAARESESELIKMPRQRDKSIRTGGVTRERLCLFWHFARAECSLALHPATNRALHEFIIYLRGNVAKSAGKKVGGYMSELEESWPEMRWTCQVFLLVPCGFADPCTKVFTSRRPLCPS